MSESAKKIKAADNLDALMDDALNKLESSKKKEKQITAPTGAVSVEAEIDKMLAEFAKMNPKTGESISADQQRSSSDQIQETFRKLMQKPLDASLDDQLDLAELGDMNKVIEQMMGELTSKDVLYDPFQEMVQKYPAWIEENEGKPDSAELVKNCKGQLSIATKVVALFEMEDYAERKGEYQAEIFELMQQMQEFGAPPEGLLNEAPPPGVDEGPGLTEEEKASLPNCNQM